VEEPAAGDGGTWLVGFLIRRAGWALLTLLIYLTFLYFFVQIWVPYSGSNPTLGGLWDFLRGLVTGSASWCTTGPNPFTDTPPVVAYCVKDTLPVTLFIFAVGSALAYLIGDFLGRVGGWRRAPFVSGSTSLLGVLSITIFPPFLVYVLIWALFLPIYDLLQSLGVDVNNVPLWNQVSFGKGEVFLFLTAALVAAVAVGMVIRGYARRRRRWVVASLALPLLLVAVGVGIALSGLGPYVLDVMFRYGEGVAVASGSPALALLGFTLIAFGQVLFMMRVSVLDERADEYVLTAWAKGLTKREIRDVHIARNAMAPTLAATFLTIPTVLAGMIIVEAEMEIQGLATQFFVALINIDVPDLMAILAVLGVLVILLRLCTDLVIAFLDPRQRVVS
jgi:ABC-type dipeptide/oligopeptide/nickel transport system permease component